MNITDPADPLLPPSHEERHRSARERQRKGPMWGCLKLLAVVLAVIVLLLLIAIGGGWWYVGTTSFEELVRLRIEQTLESRLGREVSIGSIEIVRTRPQKVILNDLRIANAPGGVAPQFAIVRQVEITGGIDSFWQRRVRVGRVDVRDPQVWFEIFPEGAALTDNFPRWKAGPKRRYEIVRIDIGRLFVAGGTFSMLDRKHDISAVASGIASEVAITRAEGLYEGVMRSPRLRVRLQEYEPFDVSMRGGFRYTPGVLALRSVALAGEGIEAFVAGKIDPLTEGVYDLRLTSQLDLERVREIFRLEQTLEGAVALDTRLRGKAGSFALAGGWRAPKLVADTYELADARGQLDVTGQRALIEVESARYGGGTIAADYVLAQYGEPYPMKVDLRYNGISLEQLFADWGLEGTGLRAAATGSLTYRWNKERLLEGSGVGSARLAQNAVAFSSARYPVPVAGSTDFAIDRGVITFRRADLQTAASQIGLTGTLQIEDIVTNLQIAIRSGDFSELDRIAYNFAHATGNTDFDLLGLGGAGTITGTVRGPIAEPQVVARISSSGTRYNEVLLGDADIALRYDGARDLLTFERAVFTHEGGRLVLTGTVAFPERGPGPRFEIALEASGYPAQRAIDAMGLDMQIGPGLATGRMMIAGTPEAGRATFSDLTIRRAEATLALDGTIDWLPGEGNVAFDLQVAATDFPVADIAGFLDFADIPVTGELTGTLRLAGRKEALEGAGRVTVRRGTIFGEQVDVATADIEFTRGRLRARDIVVQAPAGEVRGEAELDLATGRFGYTIETGAIDLSRLEVLAALRDLFGGNVIIRSSGAGTFEQPELVVDVTVDPETLRGLELPEGAPPPSLYLAIRNGRLIVRGAIADFVSIEGEGAVGENLEVDGAVRITVTDLARALTLFPATATLPASGSVVIDLRLGGRLSPLEALVVEATVPVFDVRLADQAFTAPEPLRLTLRNGRLEFDSFLLRRTDSSFAVAGFVEVTGARRVDLDIRGRIEAALLQLFMPDARALGHMDVSMSVDGTLGDPRFTGVAELRDAQVKLAGFPQLIDEINGTLRFRGDRIVIESLRATVGGGTVVAGGFVALEGFQPTGARVTLQGTGVAIRYYEGVTVEGNFTLLLTADAERAMLQGEIDVTRALYFRDFDIQRTLLDVILARDRVTAVTGATWQERVGLNVQLTAPGTLAVRNNIADVTGSAQVEVTGTVANPNILGEITLDEGGAVRIQNVNYRVIRGTIAFQNPFRIDPFFDVTIEGTASGTAGDLEGGPLQITVNLTGTLDRLTPTITSDPPASDITLFSILGLGGLGSRAGGQQAGGFGVFGQSLLYQGLSSLFASRVLPFVDAFTYDPGILETGAGAGARVTFEKRISDKIRFLLVYNLDNSESRQVVEWLVNPNWTLQLARDERDEYRLDARFRRRYDAYWRIGGRDEGDRAESAAITAGDVTPAEAAARGPRLPAVTNVEPGAADERPIAQINLQADAPFDTTAVAGEVTLSPGEIVSIRGVQTSIKNLFATGSFRDIRVDASPEDGGVVLTFSLFLHYRIGDIDIEGIPRNERARARRDLRVRVGEILSLDAVDDSAAAIEGLLNRRGYLEATVDPETTFDRERSIADVTFHVTPGPQATVGEVILAGDLDPFTEAQLIRRMRRRPGRSFHLGQARDDAERIEDFLVRRDYRRARVNYLGHTYDPASESVTTRYDVEVGPLVRVDVAGVPRRAVRRWLPFRRGQEYSEDAIDLAAERIASELQRRGHYEATVDTESRLEENVWTTTFHVDPGPRFRLTRVAFTGNRQVEDEELHDLVETTPRGGFRRTLMTLFRRPAGVTREQISEDRAALEAFYRLRGFTEAAVAPPIVETRADGTMTVEFPIAEGPQTLVTELRREGNEAISDERLPEPALRPGDPLNPQLLNEDVIALQTFYAERGYVEVQVAPRVQLSDDRTAAIVAYTITEGPQVNIADVGVRGNTYTDRDVVLRKSGLEAGQPFSYTSMLEAQRELYRLGIFQRVEVQPQQTGTTVGDRNVVLQVEEGRNLTLSGAIGLRLDRAEDGGSDIDERIAVAAAHRNLFGTGRYLGFQGVFGTDQQEAFLTYREPFVSRWNVPVQLQIFQSDDNRRGSRIRQQGASIEATKVARLQTRWSLRYEYKISKCVSGQLCARLDRGEPVEELDRSLLNIEISSITPTFFWDRRDDILDPRRGFFTSASVEYAFPIFAADANFLKEFLQGAYYVPIGSRTTLALSSRLGLIHPLGGTESADVPLSERFTAGGENTHRAFSLDRLGDLCVDRNGVRIRGCTRTLFQAFNEETGQLEGPILPIGGSGLLLFTAEYRFPIFASLGGAVFVDAGNVYAEPEIRLDEIRYGAGIGVRYLSPVGPLRIDVAMPFDRRHYEDPFQFFVTLGYSF